MYCHITDLDGRMKGRFSTLDIISMLEELQQFVGLRVNQVYDVDNKGLSININVGVMDLELTD